MTTGFMLGLAACVLVAWAWYANLAARELANEAASETCTRAGVQMLDGTVAFQGIRWLRPREGGPGLRRTYVFDYTEDGNSRRRGFVVLDGQRVEIVGLGPRPVT